ncbi:MAG: hypothetical protein ACJA0V_004702 [Planctomycetota bacterium]
MRAWLLESTCCRNRPISNPMVTRAKQSQPSRGSVRSAMVCGAMPVRRSTGYRLYGVHIMCHEVVFVPTGGQLEKACVPTE